MKSRLSLTISCVLALAGAACGDDSGSHTKPDGDGSVAHNDGGPSTGSPDASTPDAGTPDSGGELGDGAISLVDYVNNLIDNHTDNTSAPDDVASRNIVDNPDPTAFNSRFP